MKMPSLLAVVAAASLFAAGCEDQPADVGGGAAPGDAAVSPADGDARPADIDSAGGADEPRDTGAGAFGDATSN